MSTYLEEHYNMLWITGGGKADRFFIDGERVSKKTYDHVRDVAYRNDCFETKVDDGRVRHYHVARIRTNKKVQTMRIAPDCRIVFNLQSIHNVPSETLATLVKHGFLYNPENYDYDEVVGAEYLYPTSYQPEAMKWITDAVYAVKYSVTRPSQIAEEAATFGWYSHTTESGLRHFETQADGIMDYLRVVGYEKDTDHG